MSNRTPIRVDATFTPSGTQDVNIVSSIVLDIAAASLPLPTGASTEATQLSVLADLDKFTFLSTRLLVDGSQVTQPISGTVSVSNFPASQVVTQGTTPWIVDGSGTVQPVSGPLTDTELRASPVPVTIPTPVPITQSTTPWIVDGSGFTQPVSGTITALQGTSPWVVSGTITTSPDVNIHDGTGVSISSTGSSLNVDVTNTVPISGTITANQGTSPWIISGAVSATQSGAWTTGRTWTLANGTDSIAAVQSGAWTVAVNNFPATQPVSGTVTALQGTSPWVISGTVAATQSGTWNINDISGTISLPTGAATEATLLAAKVDLDKFTFTATRLLVDGSGVTQPVSGIVTSNQGTPAATANRWPVQITDGTDLAQVSAAGALLTDSSAVTQPISAASLPLPTGAATEATLTTLLTTSAFQARINTLGQKTMANSTPVVIASDQSAISVSIAANAGTATVTRVATSTIVATALAANSSRTGLVINTEAGTTYVKFGSAATTTDYTVELAANSSYDYQGYKGIVTVIRSTGTGNIQVTEII